MREKISEANQPKSVRGVFCTPDQLRIIADRLEREAKNNSLPGDVVEYQLTRSIMLFFDPELTTEKFLNSAVHNAIQLETTHEDNL